MSNRLFSNILAGFGGFIIGSVTHTWTGAIIGCLCFWGLFQIIDWVVQ